ncbi:CPBP family intramembrane metalloprotease [Halogeometricum borinquense]|uniref:CPBP family intramembrane metalloprotease n=1 Tax=Halogeometricum borinquense TaxID=60847 RepID=A0A6C0USV9_9EURY|nr:type II CAAX endopeptidase family protein [Halogeometricum borinquense]QIB76038.1 CPBP family intramembrane metalloprotease [Halogeometricum borinquense]
MTGPSVVGLIRQAATTLTFGKDERPRAVYRAIAPLLVAIVGLIAGNAVATLLTSEGSEAAQVVESIAAAVVVLSGLAVTAHYFDGRSLVDYGFKQTRKWAVNAIVGGLAGVTAVSIAFGIGMATGSFHVVEVVSVGDVPSLLPALAVAMVSFVAVSVLEETVFRGAVLTNVAEGLATRSLGTPAALGGAWLISTVVFGVLHGPLASLPSGATQIGMFVVWTTAGGVFGVAYLLTGELALPIGLHTGVNWAANYLFLGTAEPTLFRVEFQNRALWHPIAGLPLLTGLVLAVCLIAGYTWQRNDLGLHEPILQASEKRPD